MAQVPPSAHKFRPQLANLGDSEGHYDSFRQMEQLLNEYFQSKNGFNCEKKTSIAIQKNQNNLGEKTETFYNKVT